MEHEIALQEDFITDLNLEPAIVGHDQAVRLQRLIAFLVVVIPFLGVLAAAYMLSNYGVSNFGVSIFIVMYCLGMLGITLGFHRHFAHRSFQTGRAMQLALAILGSMSAQGPLFFWVATHRRHHGYSDRLGDPHSPQLHGATFRGKLQGFWHGHIGWMFARELTNWLKYVPDLLKDQGLFVMHRLYFVWLLLGLFIPALLGLLITGTAYGGLEGFIYGGLVRIFFVNHALWCVGSISHMYGGRPLKAKTKDHSANNFWVALAAFGEGNQNNHHAYPRSARHGLEWWQPDFTYSVIQALAAAGLVWKVAAPNRATVLADYQKTKSTTGV